MSGHDLSPRGRSQLTLAIALGRFAVKYIAFLIRSKPVAGRPLLAALRAGRVFPEQVESPWGMHETVGHLER